MLPKILFLHGAGSNAAIFKVQTRRIQLVLKDRFDFVFAQAPFECGIGLGMSPTYEQSGPFFRWQCEEAKSAYLGLTKADIRHEREVVRNYLNGILNPKSSDGGGGDMPFVGIIAFSQGSGIASGLLLDQHELGRCWGDCPTLQFAVLVCSTYPALTVLSGPDDDTDSAPVHRNEISIPSLHVIGLQDPYCLDSKKMLETVYGQSKTTLMEFRGGHHIPVKPQDMERLIREINKLVGSVQLM